MLRDQRPCSQTFPPTLNSRLYLCWSLYMNVLACLDNPCSSFSIQIKCHLFQEVFPDSRMI